MTRTLEAIDVQTGEVCVVNPKRPKAAIAEWLNYAASSGNRMFRDTEGGVKHIGYVFGQNWIELHWQTSEPWEGGKA